MLQRLFIRNVALIDRLDMELTDGFNVLTGETGAGKSIIIDAVNLILGERASKELIRHGADKAVVEAVFDLADAPAAQKVLQEQGIEYDGEALLSRELTLSGKNVCRINGTLVTVAALKQLTDLMVDLHGQHEHQALLNPKSHIGFLDSYAHTEIAPVKQRVGTLYHSYQSIRSELLSGFSSEDERAREMDILAYQIKEIRGAHLTEGEDAALDAERQILVNSERIQNALESAFYAISEEGGAIGTLDAAKRSLDDISGLSAEYGALSTRLNDAYYAVEDVGLTLRELKNDFEFDPGRLNEIEERLDLINTLSHKYGSCIAEILQFADSAENRLEALSGAEERRSRLTQQLDAVSGEYKAAAAELSQLRKKAAERLEKELLQQLKDLGLAKAGFSVHFSDTQTAFSAGGMDQVEFLLTANPGEPEKPLSKVASGGELSRIMLAFKAIFAESDNISTLIFDEIDVGISGRIAAVVGEKMVNIADARQVICITHLPQIAGLADTHFLVEKQEEDGATRTRVHALSIEERCRQIASMMDGNPDSDFALRHARELIDAAEAEKQRRRGA